MLTDPHAIIENIIEEEGGDKVVYDTGKTTKWGISEKGTGMSAPGAQPYGSTDGCCIASQLWYH